MKKYLLDWVDRFSIRVINENEVLEDFGIEYLLDYWKTIPEELYSRYEKNIIEYNEIQEELRKHIENRR